MITFSRSPCNVIPYSILVTLQCLLIYSYFSSKRDATLRIKEETSLRIIEGAAHSNFTRPIPFSEFPPKPEGYNYSGVLVAARTKRENVDWMAHELPGLPTAIYVVDEPHEGDLTVPMNKGHEAMAYLTYIIDHYDSLPDIVFFFHAQQFAWHNNPLLNGDSAETIKRMSLDRVSRFGYMNSRCHIEPGCPDWIHLDRPYVDVQNIKKFGELAFTTQVWRQLWPGHKPPTALSQPCCAQFAVSKERILENPREVYIHLRKWLMETELADYNSGRVFEYLWQYIFMRESQYCPEEHSCYCDGYGICFGSAEQYRQFWFVRGEREYLVKKLTSMKMIQFRGDAAMVKETEHQITQLRVEEQRQLQEAWKRGEDPDMRALEAERREV
ncbi:hypothetical protein IWX49DRAFT_433048 [Phyllosticta citricarpa]|uniref:Uncharacterized protein n=1 Tax=Phyllosticta citricarpa TaxID=55181 RepID=A0ABR1MCP5_9PEZI